MPIWNSCDCFVRAFAMGIANAVKKIWHFKPQSAHVELYCSSIVKKKKKKFIPLTLPLSTLCLPRLSLFQISPSPFALSLSDFSLSLCSPSGHRWLRLDVLLQCGFDVLLRWVCSNVGVVCGFLNGDWAGVGRGSLKSDVGHGLWILNRCGLWWISGS